MCMAHPQTLLRCRRGQGKAGSPAAAALSGVGAAAPQLCSGGRPRRAWRPACGLAAGRAACGQAAALAPVERAGREWRRCCRRRAAACTSSSAGACRERAQGCAAGPQGLCACGHQCCRCSWRSCLLEHPHPSCLVALDENSLVWHEPAHVQVLCCAARRCGHEAATARRRPGAQRRERHGSRRAGAQPLL